jgi:hypothetical protein
MRTGIVVEVTWDKFYTPFTQTGYRPIAVCTENLNPDVVIMKSAKDGV